MKTSITILFVVILASCAGNQESSAPYTQATALTEPMPFTNGEIRTTNGISFSKDGFTLYTSRNIEKTFDNGRSYAGIFKSTYVDSAWTQPEQVNFGWEIDAYHPVLSMDNHQLFFNSRSHADSANQSIKHNIWVAKRTAAGWGEPAMIETVNSPSYDSYPSATANGNLYFNSDRPSGKGGMDIYLSRFVDGTYEPPVNLGAINSSDVENDLVVNPDERFIIFNRYFFETGTLDLFISYKQDGTWTTPQPLDLINEEDKWELTPTLSPDGNYFFYELDGRIMQIDLEAIISR